MYNMHILLKIYTKRCQNRQLQLKSSALPSICHKLTRTLAIDRIYSYLRVNVCARNKLYTYTHKRNHPLIVNLMKLNEFAEIISIIMDFCQLVVYSKINNK